MARPIRVHVQGAVYHVLSRGNKGDHIFDMDEDKRIFVDILGKGVERHRVELHAYCVMGNHYHLLLSAPENNMPALMQYVGSGYGGYMQRRHDWIGHVFAGRYKSICVQKERYLAALSRYIHLNPVRSGKVRRPEDYRWSSYRSYVGEVKSSPWLNVEWILKRYGREQREAQVSYRAFTEERMRDPECYPSEETVGGTVLGDRDFVRKVVKATGNEERQGKPSVQRYLGRMPPLEVICHEVCTFYGVDGFSSGNRKEGSRRRRARAMFIWLAREKTTAQNRMLAQLTGISSRSAISHQLHRTTTKIRKSPSLMEQWQKESNAILSAIRGSGVDC